MDSLNLYLVHCGFYDLALQDGIYESHVNLLVAATSFEDARAQVKADPEFRRRKMHVDGIQWIQAASGYRVVLEADPTLEGKTKVVSHRHRDLAPVKPPDAP